MTGNVGLQDLVFLVRVLTKASSAALYPSALITTLSPRCGLVLDPIAGWGSNLLAVRSLSIRTLRIELNTKCHVIAGKCLTEARQQPLDALPNTHATSSVGVHALRVWSFNAFISCVPLHESARGNGT